MSAGKIFGIALLVILAFGLLTAGKWFENLDAHEIMVVQSPVGGDLSWYTSPGIQWQGWGTVTKYRKLSDTDFDSKVMFNDNGTGHLRGKFQVELPLDKERLTALHTKYGTQQAVVKSLVEPTIDKVVYMTGPLMSSKESSAEKKTDLIRYIIDQVEHGVYRTTQKQVTIEDPISKEKRTNIVADIVIGKNTQPERQEDSALNEFGIKIVNFAPSDLDYDDIVKKQIAEQQGLTMKVQTARAQALEAQQREVTTVADGKANVAKAKYEQEVVKERAMVQAAQAKEVAIIQAEQQKESNKLLADAAEYYKREQVLKGEGDATRKKLVLAADGALQQKLDTYTTVMKYWADAVGNYKGDWVPGVVMGGDGKGGMNGAQTLLEMFAVKTAKDLQADIDMRKQ